MTEAGDSGLVVDNGIYGKGFADFVTMYGGEVTFYTAPYTKAIDMEALSLYLESGYSNTVTVIRVPRGIFASEILEAMKKEHNIMIAVSFDILTGQVIRIGHMGENTNEKDVQETFCALEAVLKVHVGRK